MRIIKNSIFGASKGFTLIELSIAITIIGLLMAGFFSYLKVQQERKNIDKLTETTDQIRSTLAEYIIDIPDQTGANFAYTRWDPLDTFANDAAHYPCPAPLTAAVGDSNFGVESRDHSTGKCDSSQAGIFEVTGTGGQKVFIGAVPTSTLGISSEYMKDPYHRKLTYAISEDASYKYIVK